MCIFEPLKKPSDMISVLKSVIIILSFVISTSLKSQNAVEFYVKGIELLNEGRNKEAIKAFSLSLKKDKTFTESYLKRAYAYHISGENKRAIADYTRAIGIEPDNHEAYLNRGALYFNTGMDELAKRDYLKALEVRPGYLIALYNLAVVSQKEGDFEEAIRLYRQVLEQDKNNASIYQYIGKCYIKLGNYSLAEAFLQTSISLSSNDLHAYTLYAEALSLSGNKSEAVRILDKAISLDEANFQLIFKRGILRIDLGENEKALADFSRVVAGEPKNANAWYWMGMANVNLSKPIEACLCFEKSYGLGNKSAESLKKEFCPK